MYRNRYGNSSCSSSKTSYSKVTTTTTTSGGNTTTTTKTTTSSSHKGPEGPKDLNRLPKALQNKAKYGRRRVLSAQRSTRCTYGPPKDKSGARRLWRMLRIRYAEAVDAIEEKEKEREEEEEENRIAEKELENLPALLVKRVNLHLHGKPASDGKPKVPSNGERHHTDRYACTKAKDGQAVLRRGREFRITFTFNRPYNNKQDDLELIFEAEADRPGKGLSEDFKLDEETKKPFSGLPHWAARIKKTNPKKNSIKVAIYIPGTCPIGEWDLKVKTTLRGQPQDYVYEHPKPVIVLFNPWSPDDQVHYTEDKKDLDEYILNDKGSYFFGSANNVRSGPWIYGQFEADILQISLALVKQGFGFKMSSAMADPIKVSRALSKIVNSNDDNGVLVGNWSGDYEGGTSPTKWKGSTPILREYDEKGTPVKFGQCWVFSHVMTAVCRALGLPCRSVTNFDSAHDTDGSCTIDCYYDEDGNEVKSMKKDSIWNFHVWNEVWILRPDIEKHDCSGWHAIDATPQELSDGVSQCGPSPVKAVKNGLITVGYDTAFIFSEANADVAHWVMKDNGDLVPSALKKNSVGSRISTKPADGQPHLKSCNASNMDKPQVRTDLTREYKHLEGSEEERMAVRRAVRLIPGKSSRQYEGSANLDVSLESSEETTLGENLKVWAVVKNVSQEKRNVAVLMSARTSTYSNDSDNDKVLHKETFPAEDFAAGSEKKFLLTVPSASYIKECDSSLMVYLYARATDTQNSMPHTAQQPFKIAQPELVIKGPERSKPKEVVTVTVVFTNPLDTPLTGLTLSTNGDLFEAESSPNPIQWFFWTGTLDLGDVGPKQTVSTDLAMYWEEDPQEEDDEEDKDDASDDEEEEEEVETEKDKFKSQTFDLNANEVSGISGSFTIKCYLP